MILDRVRKTAAKEKNVKPKLKQGYKGINQLEEEGYSYTKKHNPAKHIELIFKNLEP